MFLKSFIIRQIKVWHDICNSYINKEKFVENFVRRYGENSQTSRKYKIKFYDINETPPKVSVQVTSTVNSGSVTATMGDDSQIDMTVSHKIDAIMETPY